MKRHTIAISAAALAAAIFLTGWAPGPDQPKPLRPGSAKARLADALKLPKEQDDV